MGEAAARVRDRLRDALAERLPRYEWTTERRVGRTPVDVVGVATGEIPGSGVVLVEVEWRRADPVDNPVKLCRHAAAGRLPDPDGGEAGPSDSGNPDESGAVERSALCVQLFSDYYDLASGGVSAKRENAAFAGRRLARTVDGLEYAALSLPVTPPKRGGDLPKGWRATVAETTGAVARRVREDL
ncbi:MAG: hypothetical protein ABEJ79_05065 [Halolamina sp.]